MSNMNDGEQLNYFCAGLKTQVRLKVFIADPGNFDAATRISCNVDIAMFGGGPFSGGLQYSGSQPMNI